VILDRYLFRELATPFLLGVTGLTSVFLANQMVRMSDLFVGRGLTLTAIAKLIGVLLPPFLLVTLPAALLLAGTVAFARLSADSETVALKSAGISFGRMLVPIAVFVSLVSAAALTLGITTEPWGKGKLKNIALETIKAHTGVALTPGVFNNLFDDVLVYAATVEPNGQLGGVFVTDERDPERPLLITAGSGELLRTTDGNHMGFRLVGGEIYRAGESVQRVRFATYDIRLGLAAGGGEVFGSVEQIRARIDQRRAAGESVAPLLQLWMDHTKNVTFGVACLILGLLGPALGVHTVRSGRIGGFTSGMLIILVYYAVLTTCQALVIKEHVSVPVGAWLPNALFSLATLWALVRVHQERPLLPWPFGRRR